MTAARDWICRDRSFALGDRPLIMGILNVTPDSFSDGGRYADAERAIARAFQMIEEGADIVDIGGASTRPGATPVSGDEELARVLPVLEALKERPDAVVSIDTMDASVARRAIAAGARIVNDVSALTADRGMATVAAESGVGVVLMHMQGTPRTMQEHPRYENVVADIRTYLEARIGDAVSQGLNPGAIAVDPGIGFGKTAQHNLDILAHMEAFRAIGRPLVVGLSRKRFLGTLTGRTVEERMAASLAGFVYCAMNGADIVRVHDVKESRDASRVITALRAAGKESHAILD